MSEESFQGLSHEQIHEVIRRTVVLRQPKQLLATFGHTRLRYFIVSEPSYADLLRGDSGDDDREPTETVVREGELIVERPQIITPTYLLNLFQGFAHGREFAEYLIETNGAQSPGLMYSYRQTPEGTSVVSDPPKIVAGRIIDQLEREEKSLAAVIYGEDGLWDISLMKFAHDLTVKSLSKNVRELNAQQLFEPQAGGVPRAAHARIAELFDGVRSGEVEASALKEELDRWDLFGEYEDRFFDLFRKRR